MKTLLLLFVFLQSLVYAQNDLNKLYGRWDLEKVFINNKTFIPKKVNYFLEIHKERIEYNLDVNTYFAKVIKIDNKIISYKNEMHTLLCCDGNVEPDFNYLNYNGKYFLHGNLLIIENLTGIFFLKYSDKK